MSYFRYNLVLYLASPLVCLYFAWRAIRAQDYRTGFLERLGILKSPKRSSILIHCASVGESRAAIPLIQKLLEGESDESSSKRDILVTTTTPTGKQVIVESFGNKVAHCFLPIDWIGACRRFINTTSPELVIIMETELWPNLLRELRKKRIPIMLANARLSEKSLKKYSKHRAFSKQLFNSFDLIAAQYKSDADRIETLVDEPEKVQVCGNIKFDTSVSSSLQRRQSITKNAWAKQRKIWVASSIHPGEFEAVLDAHEKLLMCFPELLLIGIPRHPEKFKDFEIAVKQKQFLYENRSNQKESENQVENEKLSSKVQVLVGDTMGEVMLFCGVADLVFVGGSFVQYGGHNPLEATVNSTPAMIGPSTFSFEDICLKLKEADCLIQVEKESLASAISELLSSDDRRSEMSANARNVMSQNLGCVDKLTALAGKLINR